MPLKFLSQIDVPTVRRAPYGLREALANAERTETRSNIRSVPVDVLKDHAINANNRVLTAEIDLARAEAELERARRELTEATAARISAQHAMFRSLVLAGACEGIENFDRLIRTACPEETDG